MLNSFRKRGWILAAVAAGIFLTGYAAFAVWEATQTLSKVTKELHAEAIIPYTSSTVQTIRPEGFEWISSPAVYRNAAWFQGRLYLSSPAGLLQHDESGALANQYRVGLELPPAPLVSLATGAGPGAGEPALYIATAGEGLLLFDGKKFRQIRPVDSPYRALTSVLPLTTGRVLLGTEKKGVLAYDGKDLQPFHPELSGFHVTALAGDESSLWF